MRLTRRRSGTGTLRPKRSAAPGAVRRGRVLVAVRVPRARDPIAAKRSPAANGAAPDPDAKALAGVLGSSTNAKRARIRRRPFTQTRQSDPHYSYHAVPLGFSPIRPSDAKRRRASRGVASSLLSAHPGAVAVGTEMPVAAEEQVSTLSTASGRDRRRRHDWVRIAGPEPDVVSTAGAREFRPLASPRGGFR